MSQEFITTLLPIALIGLIALVVGAVAGFLLAGLSNPAAPAAPATGKSVTELARLWRDRRSGKISLEMDGMMFTSAADMSPQQKAVLTQVADELQLWLTSDELVGRALGVTPTDPSTGGPLPDPSPLAPAVTLKAAAKPASPAPSAVYLTPELDVKPPSMQLGDILSSAFRPTKGKTGPGPARSIAAQVDEIVQERLPASPFKDHLIMVTEMPKGGLLVRVDQEHYEGIGDVSDPEIRQFLRDCVLEWERRTEGAAK